MVDQCRDTYSDPPVNLDPGLQRNLLKPVGTIDNSRGKVRAINGNIPGILRRRSSSQFKPSPEIVHVAMLSVVIGSKFGDKLIPAAVASWQRVTQVEGFM